MSDPLSETVVGRLLVATVRIEEPTFRRSVILMLEHNEDGAMGLVLNNPMAVGVDVVLPNWQPHATAPGRLFRGGPVGIDTALGLVAVPGDGPEPIGVRRLFASIGLVDLDTVPGDVVGGIAGLRIFAGYAGWAAGQFEDELVDGAWYVVSVEARDPFTDAPGELWRAVLRRQRGELAFMATYPDDPSAN